MIRDVVRLLAATALWTSLSVSAVQAGVNLWTRGTPDWGPNFAVSVWASPRDPAVVFAAAQNGLFRSDDAGLHWRPIEPRDSLTGLAVEEGALRKIYLQTSVGIQKSVDEGATWAPVNAGLPVASGNPPFGLAILAYAPETLFVSVGGDLYRTLDGGASWASVLVGQGVRTVVVDPDARGVLYGFSGIAGLLRSTDGGSHWESASASLPAAPVSALSVGAAGVLFAVADGRLYRSTDRGDSWKAVPTSFGILFQVFCDSDLFASGTLYVTEFAPLGEIRLHRSSDGGVSWSTLTIHEPSYDIGSIWFSPRPHEIYAAAKTVYRSQDGGDHWIQAATGPAPVAGMRLAVDPTDPQVVYAAGGADRLSRSDDGGLHWLAAAEGLPAPDSPVGPIAAGSESGVLFAETAAGLYETVDGGSSWSLRGTPSPLTELVTDGASDPVLFAIESLNCTRYSCANFPFRSEDGGATWAPLAVPFETRFVFNLVAAQAPSKTVYALGPDGAFLSGPGSGPLAQVSSAPLLFSLLAAEPVADGSLFAIAGGFDPPLYRSGDGGSTWTPLSAAGLPSAVSVLIVDRAGVLYAADASGVYRSADRGQTWETIRDGLEQTAVLSLAVSADGAIVFAGTADAVYQYTPCGHCPTPVGPPRSLPRIVGRSAPAPR